MATFIRNDDLRGAELREVDLRGARFVEADLTGVVMRGVEIGGAEIDAPWLSHAPFLRVNSVDVLPLVEAELDRRFPGRGSRRATDPAGLRGAWVAVEGAWGAAVARVTGMRAGTVETSVDGEWSFAQTLRHLVLATDAWLGRAVLELEQPFHPLGLAFSGATDDDLDLSVFASDRPSFDQVLEARADRQRMVRDYLGSVTPEALAMTRRNPWSGRPEESVLSCLHVILEEEWEHLRYAVRDLDTLDQRARG